MIRAPLYATFEPLPSLRRWVDSIWVQEHPRDPGAAPTTVLPAGRVELVVNYGDPFVRRGETGDEVVPQVALTGQRTAPQQVVATGCTGLIIVGFYPWAAGTLFGGDVGDSVDRIVAVSARFGDRVERRLSGAVDPERPIAERVHELQIRLIEWLDECAIDPLGVESVHRVHRAWGSIPVGGLAAELGVSRRHLQRRMRETVGLAPKKLCSVLRFQRALACLRAGRPDACAANDCGYFDQAHMIREMRALAGVSPGALRQRLDRPLARSFNRGGFSPFYNTIYLQPAAAGEPA